MLLWDVIASHLAHSLSEPLNFIFHLLNVLDKCSDFLQPMVYGLQASLIWIFQTVTDLLLVNLNLLIKRSNALLQRSDLLGELFTVVRFAEVTNALANVAEEQSSVIGVIATKTWNARPNHE